MYRYYLFFYEDFYPSGGMEDCELRTNNFDELMSFIKEHHEEDWYRGTIAYYDAVDDKYFIADSSYDLNSRIWEVVSWDEDKYYGN